MTTLYNSQVMEGARAANAVKFFLLEIQQAFALMWKAIANLFAQPLYVGDTLDQLDIVGVGSLPVILLTSFFTGAVFALQTTDILKEYGTAASMGQLIAFTMVRELGPVLSALMFTGRVGAGIASELGGMVVSQQVDALRALGTDFVKKLVTPRVLACLIAMPLLTAIADAVGIESGQIMTGYQIHQSAHVYWDSVRRHIGYKDLYYSFFKSIAFAVIVATTSCYQGLKTTGGTRGVGKNTTNAVVTASILIIASDFFLTKAINLVLTHVPASH